MQQVALPPLMSPEAPECTRVSFKVSMFETEMLFHLLNLSDYLPILQNHSNWPHGGYTGAKLALLK